VPGFPIRTSSDQRSVDNSPRHIAASHVLHRLLMPRHPPCALKHLQTQKNKLNKKAQSAYLLKMLATTIHKSNTTPHHQAERQHRTPTLRPGQQRVLSQDPTVCSAENAAPGYRERLLLCTRPPPTTGVRPSIESPDNRLIPRFTGPARSRGAP
jgi:hypothetical protein